MYLKLLTKVANLKMRQWIVWGRCNEPVAIVMRAKLGIFCCMNAWGNGLSNSVILLVKNVDAFAADFTSHTFGAQYSKRTGQIGMSTSLPRQRGGRNV